MEKWYFIFVISLGSNLCYAVGVPSPKPEWDNQKLLENMENWLTSYHQQSASLHQDSTSVGDQRTSDPINSLVSNVMQQLVPTRDNNTNSYDLNEAIQLLNASYGFPTVTNNNLTHNGSEDQVAAFSAMFNAGMNALFQPESIPNYLNLLRNVTAPSSSNGDTRTAEALNKQFEKEYEVAMTRFFGAIGNETSETASQNQVNDVMANINQQLSQMLKLPGNATGINWQLN